MYKRFPKELSHSKRGIVKPYYTTICNLSDSVRALAPTLPLGSTMGFAGVDPTNNNPIVTTNTVVNFGDEYVWHCLLLGHEENDMMRPVVVTDPVPDAPIIGLALAGNGMAAVNFSAPAPNGGSAILSYTVTSVPDGQTATGTTSPIIVNGVHNGTAYRFYVTATNRRGTSLPSTLSNSVPPLANRTLLTVSSTNPIVGVRVSIVPTDI